MKVALVGNMVASCQAFERLKAELERRGHEVKPFLANGKEYQVSLEAILSTVADSDAVAVGMASGADLAVEEIAAISCAIGARQPIALYGDTYSSWARPHFADALRALKNGTLFVLNSEEATAAKEAYPHLDVVASGNPVWEDWFFPAITREEARAKLDVSANTKVIFVPWGKDPVVNILHAGGVIEALLHGAGEDYLIAVGLHPGDKTLPEFYQMLTISPQAPLRLIQKSEMPSDQILMAADLVVESASTLGIQAAHLRIPVIDYFTEIALCRMEQSIGTREWPPCTLGVVEEVRVDRYEDPFKCFRELIGEFLIVGSGIKRTMLARRQAEVYPRPPEKGTAVAIMADALERMVAGTSRE